MNNNLASDTQVISHESSYNPPIWKKYNWARAWAITKSAFEHPDSGESISNFELTPIENLDKIFARRSRRFFLKEALDQNVATQICTNLYKMIENIDWLECYCTAIRVTGIRKGVYKVTRNGLSFVRKTTEKEILSCLHGMWWIGGSGFAIFFVISFPRAAEKLGAGAFGYIRALRDVGRLAQALIADSTAHNIGGWVTPALHETSSSNLLAIFDINKEPIYFVRLGAPDQRAWEYEK